MATRPPIKTYMHPEIPSRVFTWSLRPLLPPFATTYSQEIQPTHSFSIYGNPSLPSTANCTQKTKRQPYAMPHPSQQLHTPGCTKRHIHSAQPHQQLHIPGSTNRFTMSLCPHPLMTPPPPPRSSSPLYLPHCNPSSPFRGMRRRLQRLVGPIETPWHQRKESRTQRWPPAQRQPPCPPPLTPCHLVCGGIGNGLPRRMFRQGCARDPVYSSPWLITIAKPSGAGPTKVSWGGGG